jgi:hypothetical protein
MIVRDATAEDWPTISAVMRQIVAAGDTFTYDPGMTEAQARAMWLMAPPDRTVVATGDGGADTRIR